MAAIQQAEAIIRSSTRAEEVNLDGLGIDSLEPLLQSLSELPRLRRLRLAQNKIRELPADLSALVSLEFLDMSGNPVSGLNGVIRGLFCLSSLKHLHIDLPFETDEDEIIVSLHSLESFNGTPLTETADEVPPPQQTQQSPQATAAASIPQASPVAQPPRRVDPSAGLSQHGQQAQAQPLGAKTRWDEADMSQVQRLYQAANSVSNRVVNKSEFDEYTRDVVNHLQTLLTGEDDPFKREGEILKAKKIMFEYCFEEIARSSHRFDANLSQVLSVVQETYNALLDNHERLFRTSLEDRAQKLDTMKGDMQEAIKEIEQLMGQMDAQGSQQGKAQWDAEKRKLTEEVGWLKTENEQLKAKLRQAELARGNSAGATSAARQQSLAHATASGAGTPKAGGRAGSAPSGTVAQVGGKVLTLRQLRDVVEDIYASKSKYDIKCAETHLPRETMEQHMYTYLNQRYGLKHLILDWATAIIQGVKKYTADDNDVAVFGKILRNEIDEEFRFVQRQLKETVHELLRVYLKGKFPLKSDDEVTQMLRKRLNGDVREEEWVDIVKYMYNTEDSVSIVMRINDVVKQREAPAQRRAARQSVRGGSAPPSRTARTDTMEDVKQLPYGEFLRILLDFQLEGHERFLAKFVRIFKQFDQDRNGVVNEHEFRQVLRSIDANKTDEEVNALLDLIDPHNNQLINFSECVTFLSSELVRMMREDAGVATGVAQ